MLIPTNQSQNVLIYKIILLITIWLDDPYKYWFMRFFDVAILANAVCIGLDVEEAEWYFLALFCAEIMLRMYAYGVFEFFSFHRLWNWFDFLIIFATLLATIIEAAMKGSVQYPAPFLERNKN